MSDMRRMLTCGEGGAAAVANKDATPANSNVFIRGSPARSLTKHGGAASVRRNCAQPLKSQVSEWKGVTAALLYCITKAYVRHSRGLSFSMRARSAVQVRRLM
jgi:hypothetical protein